MDVHCIIIAGRAALANLLLEPAQFLESGQQYPGSRTLIGRKQADESRCLPDIGVEVEIALNNLPTCPAL